MVRIFRHLSMLRLTGLLLGFCFVASVAQAADCAPVIVIPGRADVPVVINHQDARWAIVEGECGLSRPGEVVPTVIGGRFVGAPTPWARRAGYYPSGGPTPKQGRVEREPERVAPTEAQDFSRSWSAGPTNPPPADLPNPQGPGMEGAPNTPPMIVVPQAEPRRGP